MVQLKVLWKISLKQFSNKIVFENIVKMAIFGLKSPPKYCELACADRVRNNQLKNPLYGIFSNLVKSTFNM